MTLAFHGPVVDGNYDGPVATEGYKRAVYRAAPLKFSIDMLSPTKFGSSYNFGMRISPLVLGDRSSSAFTASSSSFEYDIWRKWEDCLIFQGNIETEYRRMARSKRTRLERGKGVRRNGFYKQDAASSWESLPPGPDPKSVAADVHEYIPTLTRKGTIFRASQATIDQRATEFKAFVEALWREDVPALIDEMRNDHLVRDFFSYWRRDHEMSEKQRKQRAKNSTSRTSVTSSIFSMYFSSSNLNIQNLREDHPEPTTTSRSTSTFRSSRNSLEPSRYRKGSTSSNEDSSTSQGRGRAYSTSSSNSSPSTLSDSSLDSPVQVNAPIPTVADNVSTIAFDHNPQRNVHHVHERPTSGLAVLLENQEACLKTNTPPYLSPNDGKRRKSSCGDPDRRGRIFLSLPDVPSSVEDELFPIDENSVRNSWQTIDSTSCILEGLDHLLPASLEPTEDRSHRASISSMATFITDATAEGVLPRDKEPSSTRQSCVDVLEGLNHLTLAPLPSQECSHRESTSTMATFMTDATADGVLARERESSPSHVKLKHKSRIVSGPISLSEFDFDHEFSDSDESDDILDMFLTADSFPMPCSDIPHIEFPEVLMEPVEQCPVTPSASEFTNDEQSTLSNCFRVPLSAEKPTTFSSKSLAPIPDQFNIKAKFNDSLVFLRVPDEISYKDLRQRLFNKFVGQEGIALSDSFKITFLQPVIKDLATSNPDNSSRPSSANTDDHVPYPVASADDWENVAASVEGCKLALLITDDTL
ncbi:hypothetical protein H2248_008560 [Termitomyces sp. 'cryptogamus']|nr:hypothetical protein H2248_008560 [Termitomyces sp. 'cryptogamus']